MDKEKTCTSYCEGQDLSRYQVVVQCEPAKNGYLDCYPKYEEYLHQLDNLPFIDTEY